MPADRPSPEELASQIDSAIRHLSVRTTSYLRKIRREHSRRLRRSNPEFVLALARQLHHNLGHRWVAYELIRYHEPTLSRIGEAELEEFGEGIDSWGAVDAFAGLLSGPAWLRNQISDDLIHRWAQSPDRWWRRAALVSTVVLNTPSHGGHGDVGRTLDVCRMLVDDRDDMVVKAMSWALRRLVAHDARAVRDFLTDYQALLAPRVTREVRNKLSTGLKNPGKGAQRQ